MKIRKYTCRIQGIYTLLTALWPIVDIDSFMMVSGYKTDIWLVKTVSILLLSISFCILLSASFEGPVFPVAFLALTTATGMAYVDVYYPLQGTISKIYMADGAVEIIFALCWLYILAKEKRE